MADNKQATFINGDGSKTVVIDVPLARLDEVLAQIAKDYGVEGLDAAQQQFTDFVKPNKND